MFLENLIDTTEIDTVLENQNIQSASIEVEYIGAGACPQASFGLGLEN